MQIQTVIKRAHLGIVTALAFSPDSRFELDVYIFFLLLEICCQAVIVVVASVFRALASVSMDSSARVTIIEEKKTSGTCIFRSLFSW